MKLESISARALTIPFKTSFRHASAERAATQTVWVEARAEGHAGFGEGCPREYVTGESLGTAAAFFSEHMRDWCVSIAGLATLRDWIDRHADAIARNPAAWAALELALLDLMGQAEGRSVEWVLGIPKVEGRFRYTAVLGDTSPSQFTAQLQHYVAAGFRDFKIKLSGEEYRDSEKVRALKEAGIASEAVRADANNLWDDADLAIRSLEGLDFRFHALEEPLRAGDYAGLERIARVLGTKIILDESVLHAGQLDSLSRSAGLWIVNLRVSKMGGLIRSLRMVSELRARQIGLVIGAHVGETSLLTRAALTVAQASRDILIAQEGAFGTHLLQRDVVRPPLMFGAGGVLEITAATFGRAGFGLSVLVEPSDLADLSLAP